jgi:hypothetical protein
MICFDKKIIFIHIPRCAGTSIKKYLKTISNDWKDTPWHLRLNDYNTYYNIDLKDYYIFTCVRNPYDRLFSIYRFRRNIKKSENLQKIKFKDWIYEIKKDIKWKRIKPQAYFLTCIEDIKIKVLKTESLQKDFNKVLKKLELDKYKLKCENQLKKTKGFILDKQIDDIIYNKFKIDFETFEYRRGEGELIKSNDK